MKSLSSKNLVRLAVAAFLALTLVSQSGYASSSAANTTSNNWLGASGAVAIGAGIPALIAAFFKKSNSDDSSNPSNNNSINPTATLVAIEITPVNPTVAVGDSRQFTATGTYSDGKTRDITQQLIAWTVDDGSIASITNAGLATIKKAGTTTIQASLAEITSNRATITAIASGGPVILSSSTHNLLSYNGAKVEGTIVVKNARSSVLAAKDGGSLITISSSPQRDGQICNFTISYTGATGSSRQQSVDLIVTDGSYSDAITVNAVDIMPNTFFDPSVYATAATGLPSTKLMFTKINKNGVDFLYTAVAGVENGYGVFRSSNYTFASETNWAWAPINHGLSNLKITSLFSTKEPNTSVDTLYAGTGSEVYKSSNGGVDWSPISLPSSSYKALCQDADTNNNSLYAWVTCSSMLSSHSGISIYNGSSWSPVTVATIDNSCDKCDVRLLHAANSTLYVAVVCSKYDANQQLHDYNNVYKSTNGGKNWIKISQGLDEIGKIHVLYSANYLKNNYLYVGADKGIFMSSNDGGSWMPAQIILDSQDNSSSSNLYYISSFSSIDDELYAGTVGNKADDNTSVRKGVLKSKIGENTWSPFSSGLTSVNVYTLYAADNELYAGTDVGVFRRNVNVAGIGWQQISCTLTSKNVAALWASLSSSDGKDILYAGLWGSGIVKSVDGGANWIASNNGLKGVGLYVNKLLGIDNKLYAATNGAGVFTSADEGATWITPTGNSLADVNVMYLYGVDSVLYAGLYGKGVARSNDNGESWTLIGNGGLENQNVQALTYDSAKSELYAGAYIDDSSQGGGVYKMDVNGAWTKLDSSLVQMQPKGIGVLHFVTDDGLYAGNHGEPDSNDKYGLFKKNNDDDWSQTIPNTNILSLYPFVDILYAGSDDGTIYTNSGQDWNDNAVVAFDKLFRKGLVFAAPSAYGNLYLGTDAGVYKMTPRVYRK